MSSIHAVIGQLEVNFDVVQDGEVRQAITSISQFGSMTYFVAVHLSEVPGLVMVLQRVISEAEKAGLPLRAASPVVLNVR